MDALWRLSNRKEMYTENISKTEVKISISIYNLYTLWVYTQITTGSFHMIFSDSKAIFIRPPPEIIFDIFHDQPTHFWQCSVGNICYLFIVYLGPHKMIWTIISWISFLNFDALFSNMSPQLFYLFLLWNIFEIIFLPNSDSHFSVFDPIFPGHLTNCHNLTILHIYTFFLSFHWRIKTDRSHYY